MVADPSASSRRRTPTTGSRPETARRLAPRWSRRLLDRHAVRPGARGRGAAAAAALPSSKGYPPRREARAARCRGGVDRTPLRGRDRGRARGRVRGHQGARRVAPAPAALAQSGARHRVVPGGRVSELRDGRRARGMPGRSRRARRAMAPRPLEHLRRGRGPSPRLVGQRARQPDVVGGVASHLAEVATWGGTGDRRRERRVLHRVRARARDNPGGGLGGVLAMHSLSKRSNFAGMRIGFYAGDVDLVSYLVETRKHAGLMAPAPMQAAAVAALGDDAHVAVQRIAMPNGGRSRSTRSLRSAWCTTAARARSISGCAARRVPTTGGRSRPSSHSRRGCWSRPAISTGRRAPIMCAWRWCSPRAPGARIRSTRPQRPS